MKPPKIVHVYTADDSALYVNGVLVSSWFTVAQADILDACGLKYQARRADEAFRKLAKYPHLLKSVTWAKQTKTK